MTVDAQLLAEIVGLRADVQANTAAVNRMAEAFEGMTVLLAADMAEDAQDAAQGADLDAATEPQASAPEYL